MKQASISICNQKGGIGKSTFTMLLANHLHYTLGYDVLVVDCDYQSSDMRVVESIARWVASGAQKASFSDGSDQQNAGDGNPQGSPLGRFAWPCVFPSPAFNSLPAERDYRDISDFFVLKGETIYAVLTWLRIVFPNCLLFLYSHKFIRQLLLEHLHFPVDHRLGHLRIPLCRGDAFVPQHLRERFQRHAVHQADRRGIGMAADMEGQLLVDAA